MESTLPTLPTFQAFLEGARLPSDDAGTVQGDYQRACRMDATSIVTSTDRNNTPMLPQSAQKLITRSPLENNSACKASRVEESGITDIRRRILCQRPGFSHILLSSEEQAEHEALYHNDWSSSDSASLAEENNKRRRPREAPKNTFPSRKKRQRMTRNDSHGAGSSRITETRSSISSKTLRAKPSVRCASSRRGNIKTDSSDMDLVIQHKVDEDKVAHKRAEQKRRNELSSLIIELELWLLSEFLDGCQPRNKKPGYTKNGTLKAVLSYLKHQATVIEEQNKIIEAQAAANAALKKRVAGFDATGSGKWDVERTSRLMSIDELPCVPTLLANAMPILPFKAAKHYSHG